MPVYGKGRVGRLRVAEASDGDSVPTPLELSGPNAGLRMERDQITGRREVVGTHRWKILKTRLSGIHLPIAEKVGERMELGEAEPVVLDWGCGPGDAIDEVAKTFKTARCYGYSRESYPEWTRNERVKFIQAATGDLGRYLRDESVDVIYSNKAIVYLQRNPEEYFREVDTLLKKLKHGGYFLVDRMGEQFFLHYAVGGDLEVTEAVMPESVTRASKTRYRVAIRRK